MITPMEIPIILLAGLCYCLPSLIAILFRKKYFPIILMLNVCLGWLGFFKWVLLAFAILAPRKPRLESVYVNSKESVVDK
jgi:hypothetical protein